MPEGRASYRRRARGGGEGNGCGGDAGVGWRDGGGRGVVVLGQRQEGIGRRGAAGHPRQVVEEAAAVEGQVGVVVVEIDDFLGDARLGAVAAAERLWLSWRGHRRLSLLDRFAGRLARRPPRQNGRAS